MKKPKRYIVLPAVLLLYLLAMAYIFRDTLTVYHDYWRYFGTLGVELLVLAALFFFLKKKDTLRREREERENGFNSKDKDTLSDSGKD